MKKLVFFYLISLFICCNNLQAIIIKNETADHITVSLDLEGDEIKVAVSPLDSVEEYLPEGIYYISVKKATSKSKPYALNLAVRHNDTIEITAGSIKNEYNIDILSVDEEDMDEEVTYKGVEVFDKGQPLLPEVVIIGRYA